MLYNKKCFFYFSTTARNCLLTQHVINMMMIMTILSACGRWLCIEYIAEILFAVNMEGRKYTEINTSPRPGSHHKPGQHWWDWGGAITGSFRPLQSCSVRAAINWKRCETARISAGKWGHCGGQLMCRLNRFANLQPACSQLKLPDGTRPRSWIMISLVVSRLELQTIHRFS